MKQKLLYILFIIFSAFAWSGEMLAQTTSYVLNQSQENELNTIETGPAIALSGPGATLTFQAKGSRSLTGTGVKYFHVEKSTDDGASWSRIASDVGLSTNYQTFTYNNIGTDVTHIRFLTTTGSTYTKYYKDVKVTRATLLVDFPYSTSNAFDMGSLKYGKTTTADINNVTYHNTTYPQNLTGTCSMANGTESGTFSVGTVTASLATGTINIPITFNPQSVGEKSATVTLKLGSTTVATFKVTGTGADKGTPAFTWNVINAYKNHSYSDFFSSTNTETTYTITSSNPSLGEVVNGKLVFYDGEGTVIFTVAQNGNEDWHAKTETFTVNVTEAQNHLPLTITQQNHSTLVRSISGSYAWDSDGIRLGDGGGGFNYDDKLAEINFEGIPDKITFDYEKQASGATGLSWSVLVSTDGNQWSSIWNSDSGSGHADVTIEDANVRYARLCYSGNFGGYFKNIIITERRYLTASTQTLAFDTNIKGNSVAKTFTLSHCNAGYGVTLTSSDRNFTVSPSLLTSTGGDIMGTETITVNYLNNALGEHNGTIVISDPNGVNDDIVINVSGTTQTIYYAHAEARSTEGGSATVSFESFDAATQQSTNKSFGPTTSSAPKTNIYYKAVPVSEDYEFVGWKQQLSDANYVYQQANYQIQNFTYDSEDEDNPTTSSFIAVFRKVVLILEPSTPDYLPESYRSVTLHRTFAQGYSTIALPFATTVAELTNRTSDDDWVAQLATVTYNARDGYTLFFQKKTNGRINAFEPYILYLGSQVVDPSWTDIQLPAATPATITPSTGYGTAASPDGSSYSDWTMTSNFTAGKSMVGLYGVVNAAGGLKLGGSGSTLNAFTAFITPPAGSAGVKTRSAFVDEDGVVTVVEGLPFEEPSTLDPQPSTTIYGLDGKRRQNLGRGINLLRLPDGSVRKVSR